MKYKILLLLYKINICVRLQLVIIQNCIFIDKKLLKIYKILPKIHKYIFKNGIDINFFLQLLGLLNSCPKYNNNPIAPVVSKILQF